MCKKSMLLSTFNVRTLNTINQLPELVSSAIELNINVYKSVFRNTATFTLISRLNIMTLEKAGLSSQPQRGKTRWEQALAG